MIYYAKTSCMIDGVSYNAGEIVPETVVKTSGSMVMHLLRKEGEPLVDVTPSTSIDAENAASNDIDDEDLPDPEQKSDSTSTVNTTPIETSGSDTTTTPATTTAPAKDAKEKKETK